MTSLLWISVILLVFICAFLIMLILIQKGRGGGLASAFGGAGGNTAFGSKTGDVLTWATSVVFGIFLVLSVVSNLVANKIHDARTGRLGGSSTATATETAKSALPTQAPSSQNPPVSPGPGITTVNPLVNAPTPATPASPTIPSTPVVPPASTLPAK